MTEARTFTGRLGSVRLGHRNILFHPACRVMPVHIVWPGVDSDGGFLGISVDRNDLDHDGMVIQVNLLLFRIHILTTFGGAPRDY